MSSLVLVPTEAHKALLAPECGVSPPILMRVAGLWRTPAKAQIAARLVNSPVEMHGLALANDGALVFPGIDKAARYWATHTGVDISGIGYALKADGIARRLVEAGLAVAYAIDEDGRGVEIELPVEH